MSVWRKRQDFSVVFAIAELADAVNCIFAAADASIRVDELRARHDGGLEQRRAARTFAELGY